MFNPWAQGSDSVFGKGAGRYGGINPGGMYGDWGGQPYNPWANWRQGFSKPKNPGPFDSWGDPMANFFMTQGTGGGYQPDGLDRPMTSPSLYDGEDPDPYTPNPNTGTPYPGMYGYGYNQDMTSIPEDLRDIRTRLSEWFMNHGFDIPRINPEELRVPMVGSWNEYANILRGGLDRVGREAGQVSDYYRQFLGQPGASMDLNYLAPFYNALGPGGTAQTSLDYMARSWGEPGEWNMLNRGTAETAADPALEAIRTRSMGDLQDQLAQIREQYGGLGLGAGSDIASALATGASRGIADMNAQMTGLMAQLRESAASRNLQGAGLVGNIANRRMSAAGILGQLNNDVMGNVGNILFNQGQLQLGNRQNQLAALGGMSQNAGAYGDVLSRLAPSLAMYPQMEQQLMTKWYDDSYNELMRQFQGPPMMNAMLSYATGFPPTIQPYQRQGGWGAAAGGILSGIGSILPWIISDRDAKEDIEEVEVSGTLDKLRKLPIAKWKYKGDPTPHIGPMAQDVTGTFGVGDGKTIHLADTMGIMFSALKEIANATA